MHPNEKIIQGFYTNFKNLNAPGMKIYYHPKIQFSDPVFPSLVGNAPSAMWGMLIDNLKKSKGTWQLEFSNISANDSAGSCHWEAHYQFSATGRPVHNIIEAHFKFQDGLIIGHTDSFDFYRWARMAFGLKGTILGWMPFFKSKVRATVKALLAKYMERN